MTTTTPPRRHGARTDGPPKAAPRKRARGRRPTAETADLRATPVGETYPGVEIHANVLAGIAQLTTEAEVLFDGNSAALVDADPAVAACVAPVLLGRRDATSARVLHDVEVFGPVATLMPYRDEAHALALVRRGQGSLVTSLYGSDESALAQTALAVAASHGRVHVITPDVAQAHSGHGNVMPMSQHGGPGRAGGGAELGGLRALDFYHQRSAVQASPAVLAALGLPDLA